jgi:hypothetical protein
MDGSGFIDVPDAQMALIKTVGLRVGERCSIGTGDIVFWMQDPREIGSLQFAIDYSETGGSFAGLADQVECVPLIKSAVVDPNQPDAPPDGALVSFNNNAEKQILSVGIISLEGFEAVVDLFRCKFELPSDRTNVRFHIHTEDATDPNLVPLEPLPQLGYRVE